MHRQGNRSKATQNRLDIRELEAFVGYKATYKIKLGRTHLLKCSHLADYFSLVQVAWFIECPPAFSICGQKSKHMHIKCAIAVFDLTPCMSVIKESIVGGS